MGEHWMNLLDLVATYQVFPPRDDKSLRDIVVVLVDRKEIGWYISDGIGSVYSAYDKAWMDELEKRDVYDSPIDAIRDAVVAVELEIVKYEEMLDVVTANVRHAMRNRIANARIYLEQVRGINWNLKIGG